MKTYFEFLEQHQVSKKIEKQSSRIKYLMTEIEFDFDVYLNSCGVKLQRPFVWSLEQQREFIMSIFLQRQIPQIALILDANNKAEVIDGKQRLMTIQGFYNNKFAIELEGMEFYYKDLPLDYKSHFDWVHLDCRVAYYDIKGIDDNFRIQWFNWINFAGTEQDKEHKEMITKLISK